MFLILTPQPHVTCGDQLIHSIFLQSLASLTVGLGLDQFLSRTTDPPHHKISTPEPVPVSPEWAWLATFSATIKSAEALAKGSTFPETFNVPDLSQVSDSKFIEALVGFYKWTFICMLGELIFNLYLTLQKRSMISYISAICVFNY